MCRFKIGVGNNAGDTACSLRVQYNTFDATYPATCGPQRQQKQGPCLATAISLSANTLANEIVTRHRTKATNKPLLSARPHAPAQPPSHASKVPHKANSPLWRDQHLAQHQFGTGRSSSEADCEWDIRNNLITGVTTGIEFTYDGGAQPQNAASMLAASALPLAKVIKPPASRRQLPSSLEGALIELNSISINADHCRQLDLRCKALLNLSPSAVNATSNW
jgi:hypothetical protein